MHNAAAAYAKTARTTVTPRELEAQLLLRAAARMQGLKDKWPEDRSDIDAVLTYNKKLWTVFVSAATREENPLPAAIKQNITNLAIFVLGRHIELEFSPVPEKLTVLININRELAAGLSTRAQAEAMPQVESPALQASSNGMAPIGA